MLNICHYYLLRHSTTKSRLRNYAIILSSGRTCCLCVVGMVVYHLLYEELLVFVSVCWVGGLCWWAGVKRRIHPCIVV
jgi:hypothetical protein